MWVLGFSVWAHNNNGCFYDVYDQVGGGYSVRYRGKPTGWKSQFAEHPNGDVIHFPTKADADAWVAAHQAGSAAGPNRLLTQNDLVPPRLTPRKYGPEAGDVPEANWGAYITAQTGEVPAPGMLNPHGHHGAMKKGQGSQVPFVEDTHSLLEFYDVNWWRGTGPDGNLIHAPNTTGQHTTASAQKLLGELQAVHNANIGAGLTWQQGRAMITSQLQNALQRMANLQF